MKSDNLIAAVWIKFRLDILVQIDGSELFAPVGSFACSRTREGSLHISGPGINEDIPKEQVKNTRDLLQYVIKHGDSIVGLPRKLREQRILATSKEFGADPDFTKVALTYAHVISDQ